MSLRPQLIVWFEDIYIFEFASVLLCTQKARLRESDLCFFPSKVNNCTHMQLFLAEILYFSTFYSLWIDRFLVHILACKYKIQKVVLDSFFTLLILP